MVNFYKFSLILEQQSRHNVLLPIGPKIDGVSPRDMATDMNWSVVVSSSGLYDVYDGGDNISRTKDDPLLFQGTLEKVMNLLGQYYKKYKMGQYVPVGSKPIGGGFKGGVGGYPERQTVRDAGSGRAFDLLRSAGLRGMEPRKFG